MQKNEKELFLNVVGVPKEIIARSSYLNFDGKSELLDLPKKEKLMKKLEILTQKGLRVLALAQRIQS